MKGKETGTQRDDEKENKYCDVFGVECGIV